MEPREYIVARINGEYAYLTELDSDEELCVTLFLLPAGVDVGTRLHYEMMSYTIVD